MSPPSARTWMVRGGALALLLAAIVFARQCGRFPDTDGPPPDAAATPRPVVDAASGGAPASQDVPSRQRVADAALPALDCVHPAGDAARLGGAAIPQAALCERLGAMGGVRPDGVDRAQARLVLDQLVDAALVARALAWERAAVSEAEVTAALGSDAGASTLLRAQLRERLELQKLVALRERPREVTEAEVDAEVARGAPGIDRGQGVRVEAWIARVPPAADPDAAVRATARQAAEAFARAVETEAPEAAAARLRMARVAPFVVGANGVEPALERAAFALDVGRFSEAVETRVGWMVLRPTGRAEGERLRDDEMRARVRAALERQRLQGARESVLNALRGAARIDVLVGI